MNLIMLSEKLLIFFALIISLATSSLAYGKKDVELDKFVYREDRRIAEIRAMISSFLETKSGHILDAETWVSNLAKTSCNSGLISLKIECLLTSGTNYCREKYGRKKFQDRCFKYMDVLIINSLSEGSFLSRKEKYQMVKKYKNFNKAVKRELMNRYGAVATSFAMSKEFKCGLENVACFAEGVDNFCQRYSDEGRLTWQTCVGSLIRFTAR